MITIETDIVAGDIYAETFTIPSLDEERSDNIEPACELACESDSGEDERFQSTEEGVEKAKRRRVGMKIKSRI